MEGTVTARRAEHRRGGTGNMTRNGLRSGVPSDNPPFDFREANVQANDR
jgi:hypothetical protein